MSDTIEQLTEANRVRLTYRASGFGPADEACAQALRIIDAQAAALQVAEARIAAAIAELDQDWPTYDDRWGDTAKDALATLRGEGEP